MSAPSSDRAGIRQAIRALKTDDWEVSSVWDGGEETFVKGEQEAIAAITAVDDARLYVVRRFGEREHGWVRFVLGNEPDEVMADWTVNLTALDALLDRWIEVA